MAESPELLMLEFLTWVADRRRTYDEAMEVWQSHCPRQTIWEDAIIDGLIQIEENHSAHSSDVVLTPQGRAFLNGNNGRH